MPKIFIFDPYQLNRFQHFSWLYETHIGIIAQNSCFVCEERNGIYISVYDRKLAQWFFDCVGTGSKQKRIKFNIKFKEDAKQLLAGYLDTDGCIVDKKIKTPEEVILADFKSPVWILAY